MSDSLVGVVLMGGQSSRMGRDKSQLMLPTSSSSLRYNSPRRITLTDKEKSVASLSILRPQKNDIPDNSNKEVVSSSVPRDRDVSRTTFAELAHTKLKCYVDEVYYSINKDQLNLKLDNTILDEYENEGPLSGIISALRATQQSVLLLGVDLPLIRKQTIKNLIKYRNWDLLTTTYYDDKNAKWEPMLSIWEIETLPALEKYFDTGGRSIQKFLNQFGNQRVQMNHPEEFKNVNTMEEYQALITN